MVSSSSSNQHLFIYYNREMFLQESCETLYRCLCLLTFSVKRNISLHVLKEKDLVVNPHYPTSKGCHYIFLSPLSIRDGYTYYGLSPLYDDKDVRNMFTVVSSYCSLCYVDLYIELEDICEEPYYQHNHSSEGYYSSQPNCSFNPTFT